MIDFASHPAFQDQDPARRPQILVQLLEAYRAEYDRVRIIELGSIRNDSPQYHDGDGHSTIYFGQFAQQYPDTRFTTVDLDTKVCHEAIRRAGLDDYVDIVELEGIHYLAQCGTQTADLIYFDGPDDAQWTMEAFKEGLRVIKPHGLLAFDDCEDVEDMDVKIDAEKGRILLPTLRELGVPINRLGKKILIVQMEDFQRCSRKSQ